MFGDLKRSRIIAYSAAFIALMTLGSWVSIPFFPVPFTLQTLFVLLAGAVMKRYAVVPVALYVVLGALGLPVFHNGVAGVGILLGPSGGYLVGFIPAALVTGFAYEQKSRLIRVTALALSTMIILGSGAAWLVYSTGMLPVAALVVGVLIFLPGDTVKACAAYLIAQRLP